MTDSTNNTPNIATALDADNFFGLNDRPEES